MLPFDLGCEPSDEDEGAGAGMLLYGAHAAAATPAPAHPARPHGHMRGHHAIVAHRVHDVVSGKDIDYVHGAVRWPSDAHAADPPTVAYLVSPAPEFLSLHMVGVLTMGPSNFASCQLVAGQDVFPPAIIDASGAAAAPDHDISAYADFGQLHCLAALDGGRIAVVDGHRVRVLSGDMLHTVYDAFAPPPGEPLLGLVGDMAVQRGGAKAS